jgi:hypothetical protein
MIFAMTVLVSSLAATSPAAEKAMDSPDTKLLCHFEGQGNAVQIDTEKGKPGKLLGNPIRTEDRVGGGLQLDGRDDAVDFGSCRDVFETGANSHILEGSVEFWFSTEQDIKGKARFSVIVDCCQSPRFAIGTTGELEASYVSEKWAAENVHRLKSGVAEWKSGEWHKVLFSWDKSGHRLFINDTPIASDDIGGGILAGPVNVTVGAYFNGTGWSDHFAGKIDELRISQPQSTPSELTANSEKLPSGVVKETRQCIGSITKNVVKYSVIYPPDRTGLPVFLHQYGIETARTGTEKINEQMAGDGIFSVFVSLSDSHCGYELQDYKDAIDDVFKRYADRIDTGNVTIAGVSYGGAVVYHMATHFPYLFSAVIPIFGIADFGYDEQQSWYPEIIKNSPAWGPIASMSKIIGDRAAFRQTRYLSRNAILAAKNNPYAHFEILHDANDGINKPGVQVEQSRRYVAELKRLGYTNFRYTETPKQGFVYPQNTHFPEALWGQPIIYTHGFYNPEHQALHHFELYVLKPNLLSGAWKRPPFRTTGELFIPSFLEVPCFRVDLGDVANNCDEVANLTYDLSSPAKYSFQIVPLTELTKGTLRLQQLAPDTRWLITCKLAETERVLSTNALAPDIDGNLKIDIPAAAKGSRLSIECVRQ